MKNILLFVLFSSLLAAAYSAVYVERQNAIPGHENECYDKEYNVFYKEGEEMKWNTTICARKVCSGAYGIGSVYAEIQTCAKVKKQPGCGTEVNLNLPYPKCCEMTACPKSTSTEKNIFLGREIKL